MSSQLGLSSEYIPRPGHAILDGLSIFYIAGCGIWTVLISCGMLFQWTQRDLPFLRIRRLKLTFLATYILHLYWVLILLGYTLAPVLPEQLLFWMTSVYYPIGLGLFFVSNAELLEVARLQQRYVNCSASSDVSLMDVAQEGEKSTSSLRKVWNQLHRLDFSLRMIMIVVVAWFFQIAMTLAMWFMSRKFHSTWGIEGTQVLGTWWQRHVGQAQGWEWWPAIAWQFFWYWVVAPWILISARSIRDTHGWRAQTSVCCLSVLLALPLWLIAIYVPGMKPCNRYWSPLSWIAISIWFIQAFTVFIPCYQVFRHQTLQQETLDAIAIWEARTRQGANSDVLDGRNVPSRTPLSIAEAYEKIDAAETGTGTALPNRSAESLFTMHALEHALDRNPDPLRRFASLREFSGENVAFIIAVREWRELWVKLSEPPDMAGRISMTQRELFKRAVRIYANYVSTKHAVYPVNISARDRHHLEDSFGAAAWVLYGGSETSSLSEDITPFSNSNSSDPEAPNANPNWPLSSTTVDSSARPTPGTQSRFSSDDSRNHINYVTEKVQYWGPVPKNFCKGVFDRAYKDVAYLVLTNTWPKYVREYRPESDVSEGSTTKKMTQRRFASSFRSKRSSG